MATAWLQDWITKSLFVSFGLKGTCAPQSVLRMLHQTETAYDPQGLEKLNSVSLEVGHPKSHIIIFPQSHGHKLGHPPFLDTPKWLPSYGGMWPYKAVMYCGDPGGSAKLWQGAKGGTWEVDGKPTKPASNRRHTATPQKTIRKP